MNSKDKIQIRRYNYFDKCFAGEGAGSYEIGYLLDLIDDASDWNEAIVEGYTAADVLANLVYDLGIGTKCGESLDDIFEAVKEAVEYDEENRLSTYKDVLEFKIGRETVAKAEIDTQKCTLTQGLAGLLTSVIFSEYSNQPDCLDAVRTLNVVTGEVMLAIQQSYNDRLASEDY